MAADAGSYSSSHDPHNAATLTTLGDVAHALGAPLCALEVVLAAKHHLPGPQAELLEAAVGRLRTVLQGAAEAAQNR
jgi:hypothetical protein